MRKQDLKTRLWILKNRLNELESKETLLEGNEYIELINKELKILEEIKDIETILYH